MMTNSKFKLLYYKIFMPQRTVTRTTSYERFNGILVSYKIPFIKRSFIFCSEWQLENTELMAFFSSEAKRLSLEYTEKPDCYICFFSSQRQRKRTNVHIHLHIIENRFQKAWIYSTLSARNVSLAIWQQIFGK